MSKKILILAYSLGIYLLLLWWHGYEYGGNDQLEILPYALKINNSSLFQTDFHLTTLLRVAPNERTFIAQILAFGNGHLEGWTFFLHALSSIFLIVGLYKIYSQFIENQYIIIGLILFLLVPMYAFNLGGNDIYYNQFTASNLAKALVIWAFYSALRKYFVNAVLLISAATLIQTIVGVHAFLLVSAMMIGSILFEKNIKKLFRFYQNDELCFIGFVGLYAICCGFYLYLLLFNYGNDGLEAATLYQFFEFRLPHHFIPTAFGLKNYLMLIPIFVFSLWQYWRQKHQFFFVYLMSFLGCAVYFVGVVFFHNTLMFSTQWFKTTIWLKTFSFPSFTKINATSASSIDKYIKKGLVGFVVIIISLGFLKHQAYQFPFWQAQNLERDIALAAKNILPNDALVMNYGSTAFKYYSEKSEYFNFKSVVHRKDGIRAWLARYNETYPIEQLTIEKIVNFKKMGITHLIMPVGKIKSENLGTKLLLENADWQLFVIF